MCRTRDCREEKKKAKAAKKKAGPPSVPTKVHQDIMTSASEGQRLWNWLLYGFGTLNNFVRGYASLQVPGEVLPQLYSLRDFLNETILLLESRASQTNGNQEAAKKPQPLQ